MYAWQKKIQKYIASKLDIGVGKIYWFAVSFHVYKKDWNYFELLPYNKDCIFTHDITYVFEKQTNDASSLIKELKDCKIEVTSIEQECEYIIVTCTERQDSLLTVRMEAYGEGDDLHLEEDYEYGVEDLCIYNLRKHFIDTVSKDGWKLCEISAKEVSHRDANKNDIEFYQF